MQIMIVDGSFFIMSFVMFRHVNFFPSFIVMCTHSKHYKTSNVHIIMCVLYETMIEKVFWTKKEFEFFLNIYFFDMYFNNLIKLYGSHHYYVAQVI